MGSSEWVDDAQRTVSLSVRKVFREENFGTERFGGSNDRAVPV